MAVSPTLLVRAQEVATLSKSKEAGKLDWKGLVPVCSWCHKIRTPHGEWLTLEGFFLKYFGATCTHTICEDCRDRHYPDFI
ncbi:MAG: hypothetical protein ACOZFS_09785 [Thermodesulfobacteriota bacterium]